MARRFRYNPATDKVEEVTAQPRGTPEWKQLHCEAMAFDGNITDAKRLDAELGAPSVDYDARGCPVFNDRQTYDRYLKAHGMVNKTSGKNSVIDATMLERAMERAKSVDKIAPTPPRRRPHAQASAQPQDLTRHLEREASFED